MYCGPKCDALSNHTDIGQTGAGSGKRLPWRDAGEALVMRSPDRPGMRAVLDAVQELGHTGPVGYWGVLLGCGITGVRSPGGASFRSPQRLESGLEVLQASLEIAGVEAARRHVTGLRRRLQCLEGSEHVVGTGTLILGRGCLAQSVQRLGQIIRAALDIGPAGGRIPGTVLARQAGGVDRIMQG